MVPAFLYVYRLDIKLKVKQRKKLIQVWSFIFIILYGVIIIYFTLFSDRLGRVDFGNYRYNLIPFNEIHRFIRYRHSVSTGAFLLNICGNLLVFAPLGFLIPLWYPRKIRCHHILIYSFSFSLCIECMQLYTCVGVFDVDDLIMNTVGGLIGWLVYLLVYAVFRKTGGRYSYDKKTKKRK